MVILYFRATIRDPSLGARHREMVTQMHELAAATPGFRAWYGQQEGDTESGVLIFDSEGSLAGWREDPRHAAVHQEGEETVYSSFETRVFDQVRENIWTY